MSAIRTKQQDSETQVLKVFKTSKNDRGIEHQSKKNYPGPELPQCGGNTRATNRQDLCLSKDKIVSENDSKDAVSETSDALAVTDPAKSQGSAGGNALKPRRKAIAKRAILNTLLKDVKTFKMIVPENFIAKNTTTKVDNPKKADNTTVSGISSKTSPSSNVVTDNNNNSKNVQREKIQSSTPLATFVPIETNVLITEKNSKTTEQESIRVGVMVPSSCPTSTPTTSTTVNTGNSNSGTMEQGNIHAEITSTTAKLPLNCKSTLKRSSNKLSGDCTGASLAFLLPKKPKSVPVLVASIHPNDVLFPRISTTTGEGNVLFDALIKQYTKNYFESNSGSRGEIIRNLVQVLISLDPPARFLKCSANGKWSQMPSNEIVAEITAVFQKQISPSTKSPPNPSVCTKKVDKIENVKLCPDNGIPRTPKQAEKVTCYPHTHDVILGRGNGISCYSGNQAFRAYVWAYRKQYAAAPRGLRVEVAKNVIKAVYARNPPGRFLIRVAENKKQRTVFYTDAPEQKILEKTCQALRELKWKDPSLGLRRVQRLMHAIKDRELKSVTDRSNKNCIQNHKAATVSPDIQGEQTLNQITVHPQASIVEEKVSSQNLGPSVLPVRTQLVASVIPLQQRSLEKVPPTADSTKSHQIPPPHENSSKFSCKDSTTPIAHRAASSPPNELAQPAAKVSNYGLPSINEISTTLAHNATSSPPNVSVQPAAKVSNYGLPSLNEISTTLAHNPTSSPPNVSAQPAAKVYKHGLPSIHEISRLINVPTPPGSPSEKIVAPTPSKKKIYLKESSSPGTFLKKSSPGTTLKESSPGAILDVLSTLSALQDEKLLRLKSLVHGETWCTWQKISESFPGLTAEQCRDLYVLKVAPSVPRQDSGGNDVSKDDWTLQDHRLLLMAVETGRQGSWVDIAKGVPFKTPQQCRNYFHSCVNVKLKDEDRFTLEECQNLLKISSHYGHNWVQTLEPMELDFILSRLFPKRTMRRLKECWNLQVYPSIMSYVAEKREAYGGGDPDAEITKLEYEKDMNGLVSAAFRSQGD